MFPDSLLGPGSTAMKQSLPDILHATKQININDIVKY